MSRISLLFLFCSLNWNAQVGINTENPKAALDIKSRDDNADKVLRFTTKPSAVETSENFVFFVGKEVEGGYDLRRISLQEIVKSLSVEIPSLRRIVTTNKTQQTYSRKSGNFPIKVDKVIFNASEEDFALDDEGGIKLKKDGAYEVSAWVGFEKLLNYEGDIIISVAKKSKTEKGYTNFKRAVVSRSDNGGENSTYSVGRGVGASFSFVEEFKEGDRLILQVNTTNRTRVNTLPGSVNLNVTRINKDATVVAVGQ